MTLGPALERVAWYGAPADADPLLAPHSPGDDLPERVRWLAGVCLGARGRYGTAARWLAPAGTSLAASCRASHLRQLGRHDQAEPLDELALALATTAEERADALVGLVADAVGRHDVPVARSRLADATQWVNARDTAWRPRVRLGWVTAETALLSSDPDAAVAAARGAVRFSREATACRHAVKSWLVLGVALEVAGHSRPAARVLRRAAAAAGRLDLHPLVVPARSVLAGIMQVHAPRTAECERKQADYARRIIADTTAGGSPV